jgi:hypothetical protein
MAGLVKSATAVLIIVLVMNPEILAFAFSVDFVGLDLMVLLLAIQMRFSGQVFTSFVVKPVYDSLCFFSARPCFMPTVQTAREMPGLLLHALPLMPMFIVGSTLVFLAQTCLKLPI